MRSKAVTPNRLIRKSFETLPTWVPRRSGRNAIVVPLIARDTPLGAIVCCCRAAATVRAG